MEEKDYPVCVYQLPDGDVLACLPDFGWSACSAIEGTLDEALKSLSKVKSDVIQHYKETGREIPKPLASYPAGFNQFLRLNER